MQMSQGEARELERKANRSLWQKERRAVWSQAWAQTANANDCKSTSTATNYADACLTAFDTRFRNDFDF